MVVRDLPNVYEGIGFIGVALAGGLVMSAMYYSLVNLSGAHLNPAVTLAMLIDNRLEAKDLLPYFLAQFVGGFIGVGILYLIIGDHDSVGLVAGGFGCNGYGEASFAGLEATWAFVVEIMLSFCFVLTFLKISLDSRLQGASGIAIGLALAGVMIVGMPLTGASVNPARSLAPACFKGGMALTQVWVFVLAPLIGGAWAALCHLVMGDSVSEDDDL